MSEGYTYLLIHPHRPGMLGVLGAFHHKYEAEQFARANYSENDIKEMRMQLWRVKGNVSRNEMRCTEIPNWLSSTPCSG
jgi:hypothetical protein